MILVLCTHQGHGKFLFKSPIELSKGQWVEVKGIWYTVIESIEIEQGRLLNFILKCNTEFPIEELPTISAIFERTELCTKD